MAAGLAARRCGARSERAAYADAGARLPARRRIRHPALSPRLLSFLAVFPAADAVRDDLARPAQSARAPTGLRHVFVSPGGLDLQFPPAAAAAGALGAHGSSRPARAAAHAEARETVLLRVPRPHRS